MNEDKVKAKLIELIPELECPVEADGNDCLTHKIRLADVLRAIAKVPRASVLWDLKWSADSLFFVKGGGGFEEFIAEWNLTTDYDNQTDEVKAFVGKLLGVTN